MNPKLRLHPLAAAALLATALAQAPLAHAGLESSTPEIAALPGWTQQVSELLAPAQPAERQGADAWARALGAGAPAGEVPGSGADSAAAGLAAAGRGTPSLWALVTTVRAQQSGELFVVLESNLATAALLQPAEVTPVPLPAALWFLLMGLLGWLGSSLRWRRASGPQAATAPAWGASNLASKA